MTLAVGIGALDPHTLLVSFGLVGLLVIVFVETGLLVGFFLPGDSLLFTAGVLAAQSPPFFPLWLLLVTVPVAAVLGDQCGYMIGRAAGPAVFDRPDARRIGPAQLARARRFFDEHGGRTLVIARFVPIVRTVAPTMAGASGMAYRRFAVYNVVGGVLWGIGVPVAGYLLGGLPFVRDHIELILVGIVVVSILPVVVEAMRARRRRA